MGLVQRCYTEIDRLRVALANVMNPDYVSTWLNKPNPAFDGSTPLDVIARGEIDRVWASASYLESSMSRVGVVHGQSHGVHNPGIALLDE